MTLPSGSNIMDFWLSLASSYRNHQNGIQNAGIRNLVSSSCWCIHEQDQRRNEGQKQFNFLCLWHPHVRVNLALVYDRLMITRLVRSNWSTSSTLIKEGHGEVLVEGTAQAIAICDVDTISQWQEEIGVSGTADHNVWHDGVKNPLIRRCDTKFCTSCLLRPNDL